MDAAGETKPLSRDEGRQAESNTELVALVFTDLVGSTQLKTDLGDRAGVGLIQTHHALVRELLQSSSQAQEIQTAGDSFLICFKKPSEAVRFALRLQQMLQQFNQTSARPLEERIGIHLGEVVVGESQARPAGLSGVQVDLCARVMHLAHGGQILMTRAVFDSARQVLKGSDIERAEALKWVSHGWFLLKGINEPLEVCEVAEGAHGTRSPPTKSEKAQKVLAEAECVLGWRPAVEQVVPNTKWILEEKLGEGGFGEVWKARHEKLQANRVFKFCFRADRVRSLKRELTLFRVLKEHIGEHPNIVKLYDLYFDEPPFYLEEEYVSGKDLRSWCAAHGGPDKIPLPVKLEVVAQAAEALQAAHDAGVIHRDVKPGNILIESDAAVEAGPASLRVKLTDFGIGQVVSHEYLSGITEAGFTKTILAESSSSKTGTQFYLAPELLSGKPASTRSDIYSLGVVLFQFLVGDFSRPLTADWASDINDDLLREDLRQCLAGRPEQRFAGAAQLSENLRQLGTRRDALVRQRALEAARERAAYRRGIVRAAAVAAAVISGLVLLAAYALQQKRKAETQSELARSANLQLAANLRESEGLRAEAAFKSGKSSQGLAMLAKFLREDPTNRVLANRAVSAISHRTFWLPLAEPLHHDGPVHTARFDASNRRIVTASADKTARIWDVASGQTLLPPLRHDALVLSAEFSRDGERVLTASLDGTGRIWDAQTGRLVALLKHDGPVVCAQFSPDGLLAVTASYDGSARVWDGRTGEPVSNPLKHDGRVTYAGFTADGERVITLSLDKTARLWDARTGKPVSPPLPHESAPTKADVSPDGKLFATGSWNGYVRFWDAHTGEPMFKPIFLDNIVWTLKFSPDGERIAIGAGVVGRVWDVHSGEPLTPVVVHDEQVSDVQFSPDGAMVVSTAGDGVVRLWDSRTGEALAQPIRHSGGVWESRFGAGGTSLVTASQDGTARLWKLHQKLVELTFAHSNSVRAAKFSPNGKFIVTGGGDNIAQVWDADTGRPIGSRMEHNQGLRHAEFSPDGTRVVTVAFDSRARIWDAQTGQLLVGPMKLDGPGWYAEFSPDGTRLLTASLGGSACMWDARTGKLLFEPIKYEVRMLAARFSPDGKRFVTGSQNRTARIWDAATGRPLIEPIPHPDSVFHAQFSPDGRLLLTVSGDSAWLWDSNTGQPYGVHRFAHEAQVRYAEFSPDGSRIATSSADGTARVWDLRTGKPVGTVLTHDAKVETIRFSPDGLRVVTASSDGTARIWDVPTGKPLTEPLPAGNSVVMYAEFDPQGTRVLTACADSKARIWEAPVAPPAPAWMPDLLECVAGEHLLPQGSAGIAPSQVLALKRKLGQLPPEGFYATWARWVFSDQTNTAASPFVHSR